jgi:hypothetical protein
MMPSAYKPAGVVIGDHTHGLGIVRSAAEAGGDVWVVNDKIIGLARFSKYLSGYRRIPRDTLRQLDRGEAAEVLLNALLDLPVEYPAVLFGVNEDITKFIHLHAGALSGKYFIPDAGIKAIYDKYSFNSLVPRAAQIDTRLSSETDFSEINPQRFVLKGRQGDAFRRISGAKALQLDQLPQHERTRLFERIEPDQVIVQEIVESDMPVVSVCSLSIKGEIAGLFEYEKLRQHPNRFGTGTYLRSVRVPALEPIAKSILKMLQFTGISEIEFIQDRRTGAYKVVEMNPRTWKSVHFATQCGQNLVARYLSFVAAGKAGEDVQYACHRYWADLATDIPQMLRERKLWSYERGFFECTWSRSDPRPAVALWTLFPLMTLESRLPFNSLAGRRAQQPVRS